MIQWLRRGLVASCAASLMLALAGTGAAANGDNLRQINADTNGTACGDSATGSKVGVGIAFDGTNLLVSCFNDSTVTAVSPADGSQVAIHHIAGASSLGALAWDNGRHVLWACSAFDVVGTIDLSTDTFTPAYNGNDCFDGLAYDASDDTLWTSPDATSVVTHSTTSGATLGTFFPALGACGNSGIAVGGPLLYLANDGCSQIYTSPKDFSTPATFFASFPRRLEDMECDNVTFPGVGAIWSKDAYDNILNAWEIPAGTCSFGGGGERHNYALSLDPATADNHVGTSHTVTATLTDNGNAVTAGAILFSVTGANTASGSGATDGAGQAAFTYTGSHVGTDTITACFDVDGSGTCDSGEVTATATKNWLNAAPVCSSISADVTRLWPANHALRLVTISGGSDPDGDPFSLRITAVTQDEPLNGLGDGDASPDAVAVSPTSVLLRAERSGLGDGRVYRIWVTATDAFGATCSTNLAVGVPHDLGAGATPVDSAPPSYDSYGP